MSLIPEYEFEFAAYLFYRIKYEEVKAPEGFVLIRDVPVKDEFEQ